MTALGSGRKSWPRFDAIRRLAGVTAAILVLTALTCPAIARADSRPYFLVATPDLPDPVFEQSVVLMLPRSQIPGEFPLVVGLIVNKPTSIEVKQIFPKAGDLKGSALSAFLGGPVEPSAPSILVRGGAGASAKGSVKLLDDLYLVTDPDAVADLLKKGGTSADLRLIMGRAQWTDDQLHAEITEGSWYQQPASVDAVFRSDPAGIWHELVQHAQLLEVEATRPPPDFMLIRYAMPPEIQVPRGGIPAAR